MRDFCFTRYVGYNREANIIGNDIDLCTTDPDGLPEIPSYVHHSSQLTGVDSANVSLLTSDIISMRNPIIQHNFMTIA